MLRPTPTRVAAAVLALLATLAAAVVTTVPSAAAPVTPTAPAAVPEEIDLVGHGWGHGRGLGQYGAYGYAIGQAGAKWDYRQILDHYYGGTTAGDVGNPLVAVLLQAREAKPLTASRTAGGLVTTLDPPEATGDHAIRITRRPDGAFDLERSSTAGCAGPWTPAVSVAGPITVSGPSHGADPNELVGLCDDAGVVQPYRGILTTLGVAYDGAQSGEQHTVNTVLLDGYLMGVVPRESPASWGDAAGGAGINALKAQAVAARSYAAAGDTRHGDFHTGTGASSTTCDTTLCQVYGGFSSEDPRTNRAVAETTGEIRRTSVGGIARTEFSSSTGGWTAGGAFPAVQDLGDATPSNPNHTWSATVPRAAIEDHFNLGTLTSIEITQRNGLGDQGGRVLTVRMIGSARTSEVSGNDFRSALSGHGVKSDWFEIISPTVPSVEPRNIDSACPPSGIPASGFTDVPATSVHRRAIDCMAARGIAAGLGDGRYGPTGDVSRGQMATFIARLIDAAGPPLPAGPDAFDDDDDNVHEASINALAAAGIAAGTAPGRFAPDAEVTRAQVATFLARSYTHLVGSPLPAGPDAFGDDDGSTHEPNINALAAEGVASGIGPGTYAPDQAVRRDQMASLLARTLDLLVDEGVSS